LFMKMPMGCAVYEMVPGAVEGEMDFEFKYVNENFEKIIEHESSEVSGKRIEDITPALRVDEWNGVIADAVISGNEEQQVFYVEAPLRKWLSVQAYRIGEKQVAALYEDVTEEKRMENALFLQRNIFTSLQSGRGQS